MDLTKFIELLEKWLTKRTEYYERQIANVYRGIIDEILKLIGDIYRKYEKEGKLDRADMYRYKRINNLQRSLEMSINKLSKDKQNMLRKALNESYEYSYDWMSWAIQKESMAKYKNVLHKSEMEQRALENPVTGLTLSETLEKHRVDVIQKIRTEVKRGIANSATYKQMADGLTSTLEDDYKKAVRVVRTETHRVKEQAVLESAQEANASGIVMHKKWLSMRDEKVRRTPKANHANMHGQSVPVNDMFDLGNGLKGTAPGMTGYPQHDINCRCITTYSVEAIQAQTDEQLAKRTFEDYKKVLESSEKEGKVNVPFEKRAQNVIPNLKEANFIDQKLTLYALNKDHPHGGPKAVLFDDLLGYNQSNWKDLKQNIMMNLPDAYTNPKGHNGHGESYESIMNLTGPSERSGYVLTSWMVKDNTNIPSLTTVYVIDEKKAKKKMEDE